MSIYEFIGMAWVILTALIGTILIIAGALRCARQLLDWSKRGEVEERRDVIRQAELAFVPRREHR